MMRFPAWLVSLVTIAAVLASCSGSDVNQARLEVVATGLINPIGLAVLPDGSVLIAEEGTGEGDDSAGVSLLTVDGEVGRIVSGLPSGRDSGDLSGAPLVGVAPDGSVAYVSHFGAGRLFTIPLSGGAAPPLGDPLKPEELGTAMEPLNEVRLVNPFDITFDANGVPVVSDASGNGVATENASGNTRFIHRFGPLDVPGNPTLDIDPVPTGIERVGAEYYVTLTGGCPYPEASGIIAAIDDQRNQRTVVDGLNMPIDVARDDEGTVWVLEFARFDPDASCFSGTGYRSGTGRLSRLDGDEVVPVVEGLDFPGAVLPMPDGSLLVSEVFGGRILRVSFDGDADTEALAEPLVPVFTDVTEESGIAFRHGAFANAVSDDPPAMMGAGVCWLDYDQDGWLDLYLVNSHSLDERELIAKGGGLPANALYRNVGGTFVDVTSSTGTGLQLRGIGCVAADLDGDEDVDLFVTADGPNALLRNNGDGTFSEIAEEAGVAGTDEWSTAAAVADVNADGHADLFIGAYIDLDVKVPVPIGAFPQDYFGIKDHLYLGNGQGSFTEVTAEVGLTRGDRTLGALIGDFDDDGDLDLYTANDGNPNRMYLNEPASGSAGFALVDVTEAVGVGDAGSGMGVAGGDYDGDGATDLLVTNWDRELNALYRSELKELGGLSYEYSTFRIGLAGLGNGQTGWGVMWLDIDHDTDLDLLIVNGRVPLVDLESDAEMVRLYGNLTAEGQQGKFVDWTMRAGLDAIGALNARGAAAADFDNDGDMDVIINTIAGSPRLLRNGGGAGHWLEIITEGFVPGTRALVLLPDGREMVRESHAGSSYLATEDPRFHFGLGSFDQVTRVQVTWPDGTVGEVSAVAADQQVVVARTESP